MHAWHFYDDLLFTPLIYTICHNPRPAYCPVVQTDKETPQQVRGSEFHKSVFPENYAVISRKTTKAKESVADRTISDRLVKLKAF